MVGFCKAKFVLFWAILERPTSVIYGNSPRETLGTRRTSVLCTVWHRYFSTIWVISLADVNKPMFTLLEA